MHRIQRRLNQETITIHQWNVDQFQIDMCATDPINLVTICKKNSIKIRMVCFCYLRIVSLVIYTESDVDVIVAFTKCNFWFTQLHK